MILITNFLYLYLNQYLIICFNIRKYFFSWSICIIYYIGADSCKFVYVSEISTPELRQLFFSVMFLFVGFGMITESVLAMFLHWQTVSLIFAAMSATGIVMMSVIPESPTWLRSRDRVQEAERAERWLGLESPGGDDCENSRRPVDDADPHSASTPPPPGCWPLYTRRSVWLPTLITITFFACQEGSGLYVILSYSADLLRDFRVKCNDNIVTTLMSIARIVGSLTFLLMYNVKRRTLAIISFVGIAVSLVVIVTYANIFDNAERPFGDFAITTAFVSYMSFALIGAVPLPWTLASEVFPSDVSGSLYERGFIG